MMQIRRGGGKHRHIFQGQDEKILTFVHIFLLLLVPLLHIFSMLSWYIFVLFAYCACVCVWYSIMCVYVCEQCVCCLQVGRKVTSVSRPSLISNLITQFLFKSYLKSNFPMNPHTSLLVGRLVRLLVCHNFLFYTFYTSMLLIQSTDLWTDCNLFSFYMFH